MANSTDNLRAAGLMAVGMTAFCLNDATVKWLTMRLPNGEIMSLRGVCMTAVLVLILPRVGQRLTRPDRWAVWRGAGEVAVAFAFFAGLAALPLADTYTLYFAAPIMLTATVAATGCERVGARRWAAVAIGFLGVLIVIGPPTDWRLATLLPLLAAAMSVARDLATRRVAPEVGSGTVALTTAVLVGMAGLVTLPLGWTVPTLAEMLACLAAGIGAGAGYTLFVAGLRLGDLSFVAPFRYTAIPVAMILDAVVWRVLPAPHMLAGALIIIASGLLILVRERQLARRTARATAARQNAAAGGELAVLSDLEQRP